MELFQLKYFLAVAKYEHVTKAAESLHIAQPAVSQAIRHLEEEFDTPLFDRENRHITLNATGKMLQKRLTPIMAALDAIPDEIKEAAQQNQPVIHLNLRSASLISSGISLIALLLTGKSTRKSNSAYPKNRMLPLLITLFQRPA